MNDVLLVALFSSAGAALVAIASAAATIYGPAWREREQRKQDRIDSSDSARYERALEFIDALTRLTSTGEFSELQETHVKLSRFVATLRPGEDAVGAFARKLPSAVAGRNRYGLDKVAEAADKIFGWLRGEVPISEFDAQPSPN